MKRTLKSVREECRKELSKQFKEQYGKKIETLEKSLEYANETVKKYSRENSELRMRNNELESKLNQLEDWNTRLQEFVNMSDDEREEAIKTFKKDIENKKRFDNVMKLANPYFQLLAGLC